MDVYCLWEPADDSVGEDAFDEEVNRYASNRNAITLKGLRKIKAFRAARAYQAALEGDIDEKAFEDMENVPALLLDFARKHRSDFLPH